MADRHLSPNQQRTIAASAAFCVLAAIVAAPALAATSSSIPCSEGVEATLDVPDNVLTIETVGHNIPKPSIIKSSIDETAVKSSINLLAPRAVEAIREAFEEVDSATVHSSDTGLAEAALTPPMAGTESNAETTNAKDKGVVSGMNTKLPGVSDDAMSRYKKQMFRRDI